MPKTDERAFTGVSTIFAESHIVTRFANEQVLFLNMNDILRVPQKHELRQGPFGLHFQWIAFPLSIFSFLL
jgi:hypothetical protein